MMTLLTHIVWDIDPEIFPSLFQSLPIHPRWYGVLFAIAFLLGFKIEEKIFAREKLNPEWVDSLFMSVMLGTIIGARLGHVFFYGWDYYSQHPGDIIKIWEGGLASHGAVVGNLIALYFWSKMVSKKPIIWAIDRSVIAIAIGGALVRLGNFFNSEIVGLPTDMPWGVEFARLADGVVRHPAQLYEALAYVVTYVILHNAYWKHNKGEQPGFIFGIFLICVFGARFIIEFFKENQEAFEADMALNMGQWLSIPLVLGGIIISYRANAKSK
jgi:prolipoprotein diacylglyceryl transferase